MKDDARPYVVYLHKEEDDCYEISLEADEILISLGEQLAAGKISEDELRKQWEPYRDLWPDLYDLAGTDEDPIGVVTYIGEEPDMWPGRAAFGHDAEHLGISGVGYTVVGQPSPMTGDQFRICGQENLDRVKAALRDKYTISRDPWEELMEREAARDAAWRRGLETRKPAVRSSADVFRNGIAAPTTVKQAADQLFDKISWLLEEPGLAVSCRTLGTDTAHGRQLRQIGLRAADAFGVSVEVMPSAAGVMATYDHTSNTVSVSAPDVITRWGSAGPDDLAASLVSALCWSFVKDRNDLFAAWYDPLAGGHEGNCEATANVVAKTVGLSLDGFSPRYIWAYWEEISRGGQEMTETWAGWILDPTSRRT